MTWKVALILSIASYSSVIGIDIQNFGSRTMMNSQSVGPLVTCIRDLRELMFQGVQASKLLTDCDKANQTLISSGCTVIANANIVQLQAKLRSYGDNKVTMKDIGSQSSFNDFMSLMEQFRQCRGTFAISRTG